MPPINALFETYILNERGIEKAEGISLAYNELLDRVSKIIPEGREFSLVRTKLEESCFWAKRAMATQTQNQAIGKSTSAGSGA